MSRLNRFRLVVDGVPQAPLRTAVEAGIAHRRMLHACSRSARRAIDVQLQHLERDGVFYRVSTGAHFEAYERGRSL